MKLKLNPFQRLENKIHHDALGFWRILKTAYENETETASKIWKQRISRRNWILKRNYNTATEMKLKPFQRLENKIHQTATGF